MEYVHNPMTGTVKYVTYTWARWLRSYGWRSATFEQFMAYQNAQYALYPIEREKGKGTLLELRPR